MGFYVERTRTVDESIEFELGQAPSKVGEVKYSRTFPTEHAASREANAWISVGGWTAEVREGRAPRQIRSCRGGCLRKSGHPGNCYV
jgi:hypothetical protein